MQCKRVRDKNISFQSYLESCNGNGIVIWALRWNGASCDVETFEFHIENGQKECS